MLDCVSTDDPTHRLFFPHTRSFYQDAGVVILTIDLHHPDSLELCDRWLEDIAAPVLVAVGCKTGAPRAVREEDMEEYFSEKSIPYLEVSLISGEGVEELFYFALKSFLTYYRKEQAEAQCDQTKRGCVIS